MPLYEVVREIENQCARNQMRDVFFEEIETDDPLAAVRNLLKDEGVKARVRRVVNLIARDLVVGFSNWR